MLGEKRKIIFGAMVVVSIFFLFSSTNHTKAEVLLPQEAISGIIEKLDKILYSVKKLHTYDLSSKLEEVLENQNKILENQKQIIQELKIIKIRSTR